MTQLSDFTDLATRYGGERYADGKADGRVQGQADRQSEVETLTARAIRAEGQAVALGIDLDKLRRELAEHMATHTPPVAERGTAEYEDLAGLLRSDPRLPQDPSLYVTCPQDVALEEFFGRMQDHQILLVGRDTRAWLETADGFRAAGVASIAGQSERLPVVSKYKGKAARTWFAMARARRGIVGLGARSQVLLDDSTFAQEQQIEDKGPTSTDGTSPGRFFWTTGGAQGHELVGSQEKLIEANHAEAVFANFSMPNVRDLGGVAFSALSTKGGYFSRINLDAAWRGFSGVPNGEAAAINVSGGRYLISRVATDPTKDGKRVGASPIMINSSPGGRWEYGDASMARAGMPTIWRSSGRHEFYEVISRWGGPGVNLEQAQDGFEFVWERGICWPNYRNEGGHPAPDGQPGAAGLHIGLNAAGRARIELIDVDLDKGPKAGSACIQLYGTSDPKKITATATQGGKPVPVAAYGKGGVVALAST